MLSWNRIGDWNPQLIREIKGRLSPTATWIVGSSLLLFQGILLLYSRSLPDGEVAQFWLIWHLLLSSWLPIFWIAGSVYMLVADLAKEKRQETLGFIRLSPRSSASILLGKLLGVPIPWHLLMVFCLPLDLISAGEMGIPLTDLLGFYGGMVAIWTVICSLGLLSVLLGSDRPWLMSFAVMLGAYPISILMRAVLLDHDRPIWVLGLSWFGLPIGDHRGVGTAVLIGFCGIGTVWIWRALVRRFRSEHLSILSKRDSYLLTLYAQIGGLGFAVSGLQGEWELSLSSLQGIIPAFWFLQLPLWLILIWGLGVEYQGILDWAIYRRQRASSQPHTLWRDLIWGENSPMVLALAINLGITVAIWGPMTMLLPFSGWGSVIWVVGGLATVPLVLIYGGVDQLLHLSRRYHPWWSWVTLSILVVFPLATSWYGLFRLPFQIGASFVYGFSGSATVWVLEQGFSLGWINLLLPWLVVGLILRRLGVQIRALGHGETQRVLSSTGKTVGY